MSPNDQSKKPSVKKAPAKRKFFSRRKKVESKQEELPEETSLVSDAPPPPTESIKRTPPRHKKMEEPPPMELLDEVEGDEDEEEDYDDDEEIVVKPVVTDETGNERELEVEAPQGPSEDIQERPKNPHRPHQQQHQRPNNRNQRNNREFQNVNFEPLPELDYDMPLSSRFFIGISGIELSAKTRNLLEKYPVGGVVIFSRNFASPAQMAELINDLQEISYNYPWKRPMFISVDHEGTTVTRFSSPVTIFPDAFYLGKQNSRTLMYETAQVMAKELKAMGFNMDLAPVADINTNKKNPIIGKRSFSFDPEVVIKMNSAFIRAFEKNKLLSCVKHFPGHGDTDLDSHEELPTLNYNMQNLEDRELYPFYKAIQQGVPAIMLAHLIFPNIDPDPVSLSKFWVKYIRNRLRYDGLVLTDDMEMGAIVKNGTVGDACLKAFSSGVDVCLINQESTAHELIPLMAETPPPNMNEHYRSLQRMERAARFYFRDYEPIYIPDVTRIFHKDHTLLIRSAMDTSGKTLTEWKKIKELPPSRRPASPNADQRYYQFETLQEERVNLTAPGGRLPEEIAHMNMNPLIRKPHREALSVTSDAYVRQQEDRILGPRGKKNNSKRPRRGR